MQRPPRFAAAQLGGPLRRLGRRPLGGHLGEGAQRPVEPVDPLEGSRQHLGRVGLAGGVQRSEARYREAGDVQVFSRSVQPVGMPGASGTA